MGCEADDEDKIPGHGRGPEYSVVVMSPQFRCCVNSV